MVESFDQDEEKILDAITNPEKIAEIKGITKERSVAIAQEAKFWLEETAQLQTKWKRDIQLLKILPKWIKNLALRKWPENPSALEVLNENPYRLTELNGVGFKKADKIALDMGLAVHDKRRKTAAIQFILDQSAETEGHTWISLDQIIRWAIQENIEGLDNRKELKEIITEGCEKKTFTTQTEGIFEFKKISKYELFFAEKNIASKAISLAGQTGFQLNK